MTFPKDQHTVASAHGTAAHAGNTRKTSHPSGRQPSVLALRHICHPLRVLSHSPLPAVGSTIYLQERHFGSALTPGNKPCNSARSRSKEKEKRSGFQEHHSMETAGRTNRGQETNLPTQTRQVGQRGTHSRFQKTILQSVLALWASHSEKQIRNTEI